MLYSRLCLYIASTFLFGSSVLAQELTACSIVYENAVRNQALTEYNYAELNEIFDAYCSSFASNNQSSSNIGIEVVVKSIPIGLTGSTSDAEKKMSNFCSQYSGVRTTDLSARSASSIVVSEALANFNRCIEIESQFGVAITHASTEAGVILQFDIRDNNTIFELQGVVAPDTLACSVSAVPYGSPEPLGQVGPSTQATFRSDFSMICEREPASDVNGSIYYPPASVAVGTNLLPYVVNLTADTVYSAELASEAQQRIDNLLAQLELAREENAAQNNLLTSLNQQIGTLNQQRSSMSLQSFGFVIGQYNPGGRGHHFGCGTPISSVFAQVCPGALMTEDTHLGTVGGHQCGYDFFTGACLMP